MRKLLSAFALVLVTACMNTQTGPTAWEGAVASSGRVTVEHIQFTDLLFDFESNDCIGLASGEYRLHLVGQLLRYSDGTLIVRNHNNSASTIEGLGANSGTTYQFVSVGSLEIKFLPGVFKQDLVQRVRVISHGPAENRLLDVKFRLVIEGETVTVNENETRILCVG